MSMPRTTSTQPSDPRARRVVRAEVVAGFYVLTLNCGHSVRREVQSPPARIICQQCRK